MVKLMLQRNIDDQIKLEGSITVVVSNKGTLMVEPDGGGGGGISLVYYGINEHSVLADGSGIGRCSTVTTVNNHNRV